MDVFQAFGQAQMSGTNAWKDLVTPDVSFTGPVAKAQGLEEFSRMMADFGPMVRGMEMKQVVEAGDHVITQIAMVVAMPSGSTIQLDMCEWYEVRDGKIKSIRVYYDADEYRRHLNVKGA